jgi:hypothetical protein
MRIAPLILAVGLSLSATLSAASPEFWQHEWPQTDFETTTVENWTEILSGGPPKDGIPSLNDPEFISVAQEVGIGGREPVITVEIDGATPRAYPVRYLTWHEIVNDEVAGIPIAVTFCPLCNSGMTFDRRTHVGVLTFGVSGKLRMSDMVMFDRETQSWWQQAIGTGIVGSQTGVELDQLPTWMESWDQFKTRHPEGLVMAEPTGFGRPYGANPYVSYDSSSRPFLYSGELPPHNIPALVRVVRVGDRAWPMTRLRDEAEVREAGLVIEWQEGQASALDGRDIASSKEVGTVRVRNETGADVPHDVMFAFAFHAFFPDGGWMLSN